MSIYAFEGKRPAIDPTAYLHESAQVIGDVIIGEKCYIGPGAIIRGDYGSINIGARTAVEEGCIVHVAPGETCDIGSDIILGHGAIIHCSQIQPHVRIGIGAIVSIRSVVEEWAVIGDGAVVPPKQTLALGRVFVGNPARDVRGVSDEEKEFSMRAVVAYADLCARCSAGLQKLSL